MTGLSVTKNTTNKIFLVVILAILCFLSYFIFFHKSLITANNIKHINLNMKKIATLPIPFSTETKILPYNDEVLVFDKNNFKTINFKNETTWEQNLSTKNPIIQTNKDLILILDKQGTQIIGYINKKLAYKKSVDGQIINGELNEDGDAWISTKEKNVNNLLVINSNGNFINNYSYLKDEFIVDADISGDNKYIAIVTLLTRNEQICSKIDFYNLNNEVNKVPLFSLLKKDIIVSNIKVFNNNTIVFLSDNGLGCVDNFGNFKWEKDLKSLKTDKVDISSRKYIVIKTNKLENLFGNSSQLIVLDQNGNQLNKGVNLLGSLLTLDCHQEYFLASDTKKIYCISFGNIIWSCPITKETKAIKGFSNQTKILMIKNKAIEIYNIS